MPSYRANIEDIITEIQIIPVKPKDGLVAFASFVLFHGIYCSSVGVFINKENKFRLVYPTKKVGEKNLNIFHPINPIVGIVIDEEVAIVAAKVLGLNTGVDKPNNELIK